MKKSHKGFTLVELLIVILIMGILASSIMLSSQSSTENADVASIISDLENLKSAALFCFTDKSGYYMEDKTRIPTLTEIAGFVNNGGNKVTEANGFYIKKGTDNGWYVGRRAGTASIRGKLKEKTEDLDLFYLTNAGAVSTYTGTDAQDIVYLKAK